MWITKHGKCLQLAIRVWDGYRIQHATDEIISSTYNDTFFVAILSKVFQIIICQFKNEWSDFEKKNWAPLEAAFVIFSRKLGTFSSFPNTVKKWQKLKISIKTENVCEKCQEMMIRLVKSESSMSNYMVILTKRKSSVDHWLKIESFPQTWSNNTGWINFNHHQYIK